MAISISTKFTEEQRAEYISEIISLLEQSSAFVLDLITRELRGLPDCEKYNVNTSAERLEELQRQEEEKEEAERKRREQAKKEQEIKEAARIEKYYNKFSMLECSNVCPEDLQLLWAVCDWATKTYKSPSLVALQAYRLGVMDGKRQERRHLREKREKADRQKVALMEILSSSDVVLSPETLQQIEANAAKIEKNIEKLYKKWENR